MEQEKKPRGNVNYVWVLAGGYLVYLAFQLLRGVFKGETDYPVVGILGGAAFAAFGGWLLWREWSAYQYGAKHKDDPSTWSDEEPEEDGGEENHEDQ